MKRMFQIGILLFSFCFIMLPYNQGMCGSDEDFEMVGYHKTKRMRGFTYYVKKPTKEKIKRLCVKMVDIHQGFADV